MEADLSNLIGRRIRLTHTDDRYTNLKYGDLGTIKDIGVTPREEIVVLVKWDRGSGLALIASRDVFDFVAEGK